MVRYSIGIDSGTQSTKAVLLDGETGRVVAMQMAPHHMLPAAEPGAFEQRPSEWVTALEATIEAVLAAVPAARPHVTAIGVSGQQHGLVALDDQNNVIRPAKLWCDTSTAAECDVILDRLGGLERAIARVGNSILPGYTASKILWLKAHEPESYGQLATVLLPHDYLVFHLTGRKVMEWGDASGTALMDVRTRQWCPEVIHAIDPALSAKLPALQDSRQPAGTLRPDLAARWGLSPEVVVTGSGDNMMGAIGTGNVREGVVTASLGTSGTIYACAETPIVDPGGEVAAFCDATGRWLPLVCTMNVTVATEMVRRTFGLDHEAFARAADSVPVGSDGLLLVPFFEGERTPDCPEGTGVWLGVRPAIFDAAHMARAAMEGVTLGLNYGLRRLRQLGVRASEIRLTGGGARSAVWRQIAADVFGCPVVCPAGEEAAAVGAALHALWVSERQQGCDRPIGELTDRLVTLDESTRATPRAAAVAAYGELQALFDTAVVDLGRTFALHRRWLWTARTTL